MSGTPGRLLRILASLLVRGPASSIVLGDLEESMRREVARGIPPARARLRYIANAIGSGSALLRERVRSREPSATGIAVSWLDVKLGLRMLVKYPGLTLVGGIAIAVAVASGTFVFGVFGNFLHPELPLPEAERLVGIENRDVETARLEPRSVHDFAAWRGQLRSIEGLSAFATAERNVILGAASAERVAMAEMSASAFRTLRVPPLLGRTLLEADEADGAPLVAVLGHDLWRSRFGADPDVAGRSIRIGGATATIVGVMPPGFGFPVREQLWLPLRVNPTSHEPREGPALGMFGRLARGFTLEQANAELTAVGSSVESAAGIAALRPRALWYPYMVAPPGGTESQVVRSMLAVLLLVASVNVATLVFARAASREAEIAVRAALGASRRRILAQLFIEAAALVGLAVLAGVVVAGLLLDWGTGMLTAGFDYRTPFWWKTGLDADTLVYVAVAALLATVVVGVIPALKVTSGVGGGMQRAARGSSVRFGGVWTFVVVFQVALTVAVLPMVAYLAWDAAGYRPRASDFPADEFLTVGLERDRAATETDGAAERARFAGNLEELRRRLLDDPAASAVSHADRLPGMDHPRVPLEIDGVNPEAAGGQPPNAGTASIAAGFFEALGSPVRAGREFRADDGDRGAVLVNESFVAAWLGGHNAVGRRVRIRTTAEDAEPWLEIVGVVPDIGAGRRAEDDARIFFPLVTSRADHVRLVVRVGPGAEGFANRLRAAIAGVDPTVRIADLIRLDDLGAAHRRLIAGMVWFVGGLAAVALLLSAAGTYALMSFIVARRTREIGIRAALGADPRRILAGIFGRAARQLGAGALIGSAMGVYLTADWLTTAGAVPLVLAALVPIATAFVACGVPAVRAMRVEPTSALRSE